MVFEGMMVIMLFRIVFLTVIVVEYGIAVMKSLFIHCVSITVKIYGI